MMLRELTNFFGKKKRSKASTSKLVHWHNTKHWEETSLVEILPPKKPNTPIEHKMRAMINWKKQKMWKNGKEKLVSMEQCQDILRQICGKTII
jgi:hypothetical protein